LTLYVDEFIIAGSPEQVMMWCEKILTREVDMKELQEALSRSDVV
jgi:hypothetical protein